MPLCLPLCVWLYVCVCVSMYLCACHAFKCFPKLPFSHLSAWPTPNEVTLISLRISLILPTFTFSLLYSSLPLLPLLLCQIALRRLSTAVSHSAYLLIHFMHLFNNPAPQPMLLLLPPPLPYPSDCQVRLICSPRIWLEFLKGFPPIALGAVGASQRNMR